MGLGIFAFGSLILDAGELDDCTVRRVDVTTPFHVEFARSSVGRDGAPTLVPVRDGGSSVPAVVLVLEVSVSLPAPRDMLYRRETNRVGTKVRYVPRLNPGVNDVVIEELANFGGCDLVLYTSIRANITPLTAATLADLAISSAKLNAGASKRDGISYLNDAKRNGITTRLSGEYEAEVLTKTRTKSLEDAWHACRSSVRSNPQT